MRTILFISVFFSVGILTGCAPRDPEQRAIQHARRECFDNVVPRNLDEITVTSVWTPDDPIYSIKDSNLYDELNKLVVFQKFELSGAHGCSGSANINFLVHGKRKGRWNFAHKHFIGDRLTPESEQALADWFLARGVPEFKKWLKEDGEFPMPKPVVQQGLDYLVAHQNTTGSWGVFPSEIRDTSLALVAFLNHGEVPSELEYGEPVEKALRWLLEQTPDNPMDSVLAIHALSSAYFLTEIPELRTKVLELHSRVDPSTLRQPELTIYLLTRHPNIERTEAVEASALRALADLAANPEGGEPLLLYLKTLNEYEKGGQEWEDYNKTVIEGLFKKFTATKTFSIPGATSTLESVSFTILSLEVCYRYWESYMNLPQRPLMNPATTSE